jgi:hypothetical protein
MDDSAEHLVRNVLPAVPVRQWVLSLPRTLRFQAACDEEVVTHLLDLFTRAVFVWQRNSRYHGVFAPNSRLRRKVVPQREAASATSTPSTPPTEPPPPTSATPVPAPPSAPQPSAATRPGDPAPTRTRVPWAELLQKVHAVDVLACPECGGRLEVVAYISQPTIAKQILDHLGLQSQAPPVAKARSAGPDEATPGPDYDCVDPAPVYDE